MSAAAKGMVMPYTTIPNAFLDLLMADCTGSEVKVVLYIARRTFGTEKGRKNGSDAIALSQICNGIVKKDGTRLDHGTGLAREAAVEALRRLEFAKIIERDRGKGRTADTWKIAAALPSVKEKAPEKSKGKQFENRTTSSSKIEPLTGSKIEPAVVRKSNPQKKGLNHHQKERVKESSAGEVSGTPEAAENQKPKPFFSQIVDDEKPKPRTPFEDPEREFQARIVERHGTVVDADVLLQDVKTELGDSSLSEFLEADSTATTAPHKLTNPHGHYRRLARKVGRRKDAAALQSLMDTMRQSREFLKQPAQPAFKPLCNSCKDGLLPDGAYCACKVGGFRKEYDEYEHKKATAVA